MIRKRLNRLNRLKKTTDPAPKKGGRRRKKQNVLFSFCFAFLLLTTACAAKPEARAQLSAPLSPALSVLAEDHSMAMAAVRGNPISFDEKDFCRATNLPEISSITITSLPPITDGELRVGNTVLTGQETIRAENLSLLSYTAGSADISTSSFRFRVGDSPVEMTCRLYLLDQVNESPTLSTVPATSLNVSTHQNVTLYGSLPCYDPEGDETIIEIVSYPKSGILTLTNRGTGEYTYKPRAGASGKDSFTYVARDVWGNYSAAATVSLTIVKPTTSVVYADLAGSPAENAALTMTEAGIMGGTQVGTKTYFEPDGLVSRGDFVVMAMRAMGMTETAPVSRTPFADDGDIPDSMKSALATAYELGYIRGESGEGDTPSFYPNRSLTRAEAAVILGRMLDAATPTVAPIFTDSDEIPAWAAPSIYSLPALGVMLPEDGAISPSSELTRAEAAQMLSVLMEIKNN